MEELETIRAALEGWYKKYENKIKYPDNAVLIRIVISILNIILKTK